MKILSNQRYCPKCGESPFSMHRHDYRKCKCGEDMVDGGMDYIRCSLAGEDRSIAVADEHYALLMAAVSDPTKNDLGKLCNVVRVLRDHMGINITPEEVPWEA